MQSYILLILSILMPMVWYSHSRGNRSSDLNEKLPDKYLIKNKRLIAYFGNPKDKIAIWSVILHFIHLCLFFLVLFLYILFWINGAIYSYLVSYIAILVYLCVSIIISLPIIIFSLIILKKYIY